MKRILNLFSLAVVLALTLNALGITSLGVTRAYAAGGTTITVFDTSDTVADDGFCTLREAITAANTNTASGVTPGECDAGTGADTIIFAAGNLTITLSSTLSAINDDLTIDGGTDAVTIDGNSGQRVMFVNSGKTLNLNNLTVANGFAANGSGIINDGTLNVTNSTFRGNSNGATRPLSGAIRNNGTLTVTNSTFSGNSDRGIYNIGALTVTNSTFSANLRGISNDSGGVLNLYNTIIANSTGADCLNSGTISANTNNLVEDNSCSPSLSGDPSLGPLANNGGPTQTFALLAGSSAIGAGNDTTCANSPVSGLDQRGVTRPQGAHCDIGAYEYSFIVTTNADPGDGTCDATCSLRDAISAANANSGADTITFDSGNLTITLSSTLPAIDDDLTIDGTTYAITIDGNSGQRVMTVNSGKTLNLNNITIANGFAANGSGIINDGTLNVTNSTFSGNSNGATGPLSGAIRNNGTLTVTNSTFSGNSDRGIYNIGALTVTNSTFSANLRGISNDSGGMLNLYNTIIANSTGADCLNSGTISANTNNLVEDGSCSASLSGDPNLGTFTTVDYPTGVFPLNAGSAAINAGDNTTCNAAPVSNKDQGGYDRLPNGGATCDIGAYEFWDTDAPDTSIDSATPSTSPTSSTSMDFTFSSTDPAGSYGSSGVKSYECQLDSGGYSACTSPKNYASLAEGSHTFDVRAIDYVGNVDATPDSYAWTVDTTAPDTQIDSGPADPTTSTSADFTFSNNDITASFECSLDAGAYAACTSPQNYTSLADGSHTFAVRAKDPAGNADATPDSYTWTVDTTAPDTQIDNGPADPTNDTSADFTFSSADGAATFECSLDAGAYAACTSPQNYTSLAAGAHTFAVRAIDLVGNVDATPASDTWTIDTTAPDTQIDTGPADPTNSTSADFTFSSADGTATFECSLDAGAYAACTSPQNYTGLAAGSHTFAVRAIDPAGNVDATPDSYTWTIDTTAPDTQIDSGPADPTNDTSVDFTFSSADGTASFECSLDAGAYAACTSPQNYTGLAVGAHTFAVRAIDPASNVDATPDSYAWTVDTTAPDTQIDTGPADPTNDTSAAFTFSSADITASFECSLDAGAYAACTSPQNYTGLAAGAHTFAVRAKDPAGNVDATPASDTWTIDTTAPDTQIDSQPANPTNSASADFTFSSADITTSFECSLDAGAYAACTSPQNYTGLAAGAHTFAVRAKDPAGNVDATPDSYTWTVDTTAPSASIDSGPADPTNDTSATFTFSANDNLTSTPNLLYWCDLDGAGGVPCDLITTQTYTDLTPGSHIFYFIARDEAGNDSATVSYTWKINYLIYLPLVIR